MGAKIIVAVEIMVKMMRTKMGHIFLIMMIIQVL